MNSNKLNLDSNTKAKFNSNQNQERSKNYNQEKEAEYNKNKDKKLRMKDDIMFKAFFSKKNNEKFLESLLSSILEEQVKINRVIHDSRLEQLSRYDKYGVLDLDVKRDNGEIINIEIQIRDLHNIEKRTTVYGSKKIVEQLTPGTDYNEVNNVIIIAILNYNFLKVKDYLNKTITVLEKHREVEINNELKRIYIELPKFRESKPDMDLQVNQWLAFIDGEKGDLIDMAKEKNELIEEADEMYNILTGDANLKRLEEVRILDSMEKTTALRVSKEEGKKEKQIEIAKELLKINMPIDQIEQVTKLTKEEIEKIVEEVEQI